MKNLPNGSRPLAGVDQLRDVQLLNVHLDEVHKHLWLIPAHGSLGQSAALALSHKLLGYLCRAQTMG